MAGLPESVIRLLWDVDAAALDLELEGDRNLVLERIMSRGSREAMRWLRAQIPQHVIADFVRIHGRAKLAPRELAYWALICDVTIEAGVGGGRPDWAG